MPLLGKRSFSQGSQVKSDTTGSVFTISHTKERFTSESEYEKRKELYAQSIWTCRATGHINMTHEDAMKSEQAVTDQLKEQFVKCFEKDVLEVVHHNTQSLETLVDQTWLKLHQQLVPGERVHLKVKVADKLIPAKIVTVDKTPAELKEAGSCNSPSSDKENSTEDKDKSPKKWTPPKLFPYLYSIELEQEAKVIHSVPADDLIRIDRIPSKDLLRSYIRVSSLRSGNAATSPWVVNADLVSKYKLVNKYSDFFLSPVKMAEASKRAEENKKKRKIANGTHTTSASKKLKLEKSKKEGKELKVLQMNKGIKGKQKKDRKQSDSTSKRAEKSSPKKSSTPKKKKDSFIVISESDEEIALSKLKKQKSDKLPVVVDSDNDSDIPLYQLVDQTTPKKKVKKSKEGSDSSDENVPLARMNSSLKKSTPKKNKKTPTKKDKKQKIEKDQVKKKNKEKESKKSQKTGMKQATLFDVTKKGKSSVQKTPVKKSPSKTPATPAIPAIVRRLQNCKLETMTDKKNYAILLRNATTLLTPAQLSRVPDKLREEILRKKELMEENVKLGKMTLQQREEYKKEKRQKAKEVQRQRMLQKLRDKRKRFEDTDLELSPLPVARMVPLPEGFPNNLFGEVAMVTEFINCYSGLLMPNSDYPIHTDPLLKALVGGSNGFTYLSRVVTMLLQTLLQDEIAKGYKEMEMLVSDIPVNPFTASELMRLCLASEGDDEEDEELLKTVQQLKEVEFYQVELNQKLILLRGLCYRVLDTYAAQDYMEERQRLVNELMRQKNTWMKQIAAQKKSERQDSPSVKPSKEDNSDTTPSADKESTTDSKDASGNTSVASFYGKEAVTDGGEEGVDWGSVVKSRRILAAQAVVEKEKLERERAAQKEKEIQEEKVRQKKEGIVDAINLARMVLRQDPIGTDRHHDRYWVFTNTTPGLYIEKGWMGEEINHTVAKASKEVKSSDEGMSSDSDSNDGIDDNDVAMNQTGSTPMKVKYTTKRHIIEKSTPHPGQNMWLTYRSVKDLDSLLIALHPQGIRESLLLGEIKKRYDDIVRAINLSQRANLELRDSDGDVEMISSLKKDLCDTELRLRNGGLGGVDDFDKWDKRLNETSDILVMGECLLEMKEHVTEKYLQGFMKPPVKTEEEKKEEEEKADVKEDDEEAEECVKAHRLTKNEKALLLWKESVSSCQTMSKLHVLLAMFDACIKWEKSAENARCKICRKKGDDDRLLLCDECNHAFHLYCLRPALGKVPTTDWFCPACKPRRPAKLQIEEEEEEKEVECRECGGTDKLIVCSSCPYAYHTTCHDPPLRRPPRGTWECADCKSGETSRARSGGRKRNSNIVNYFNSRRKYYESSEDEDSDDTEKYNKNSDEDSDKDEWAFQKRLEYRNKYKNKNKAPAFPKFSKKFPKASTTRSRKSDPKPPPSLTPTLRTSRRGPSELSLCEEVLNRVVKHKSSWPFLEPVNKKQVPDYHLVVKKPMDFQTMQKNCARLNYASPQEFIEDAALVFENAELYNTPGSDVFECMTEVEQLLKNQLQKLLPDWPYYRTVVEHHDLSKSSETGKRRSRNK